MNSLERATGLIGGRHPRAIAAGVCAELADRFGLAVWLLRVPFIVLFANEHWGAAILYVVLAAGLRTRLIDLLPPRQAPQVFRPGRDASGRGYAPPDPGYGLQRERFSALELRLAHLEAAVTSDELKLRARFRDIEG